MIEHQKKLVKPVSYTHRDVYKRQTGQCRNEVSGRMRKINTILSVLLLVIFMLHGLMGSFMLLGIGSSAGKILAWVGVAVLAAHTVIGVILTINTLKISKNIDPVLYSAK